MKLMIKINNFFDNSNVKCIAEGGVFSIYEHQHDLSVDSNTAMNSYFMEQMNVKKRQVLCKLDNSTVKLQAGAMQWITGDVEMDSGVSGAKDFFGKLVKGAVTGESAVKPLYTGTGCVMLEPTYNFLLIEDVASWGKGIVLDDGLFLACEGNIQESINKRSDVATALLSGEGIFNLTLSGNGFCVLESPVPREELVEFELDNDVLKIDGNMAIAWSSSLQFTTENASKSIVGSTLSGEGVVNVYRGTGKVLVAPTMNGTVNPSSNGPEQTTANSGSDSLVGSIVGGILK
jgi:uncharacterized protein (AIM24 family)